MDRPTVLLVGTGERMQAALEDALERHHMMVESVPTNRAVEAAFAAAPDLLVLLGDAALDGGRSVLARLGASPATSTVPVVLLADEAGLDRRLDAFRHGVVAVVPKSASADGMARRVAELARELPEREGETAGELGEATVDELVELFSQQLRTGILSVTAEGREDASAQIVLRAGRPVADAIEELVERLRPLVSAGGAGSLRYEFHESTSARLSLLEGDDGEPEDAAVLEGRRILLIEQNPARADILVQELRARGALVVVADGEGAGLDRARAMDPEVVILDGSGVQGWALASLRALRRDPRLRWASLLVVDPGELWPSADAEPDLERLASSLKLLVRADRELSERAHREERFDTRLEIIGPSRMLRALTSTGLGLRVAVQHPRARVEVDLAEGIVAGALARRGDEMLAEGPGALATLLALSSGRVHVERKEAPASANLMAPLDDALAAAGREAAPIKPSIPPPSGGSEPPPSRLPTGPNDAERLIGRLEELLERLQKVLPDEPPPSPARLPVQPPVRAIPRPQRPLSGSRRKTLALGSLPAVKPELPRYESQDDLPVIVGVAEPSPSAPDPSSAPLGPTERAPAAKLSPEAPGAAEPAFETPPIVPTAAAASAPEAPPGISTAAAGSAPEVPPPSVPTPSSSSQAPPGIPTPSSAPEAPPSVPTPSSSSQAPPSIPTAAPSLFSEAPPPSVAPAAAALSSEAPSAGEPSSDTAPLTAASATETHASIAPSNESANTRVARPILEPEESAKGQSSPPDSFWTPSPAPSPSLPPPALEEAPKRSRLALGIGLTASLVLAGSVGAAAYLYSKEPLPIGGSTAPLLTPSQAAPPVSEEPSSEEPARGRTEAAEAAVALQEEEASSEAPSVPESISDVAEEGAAAEESAPFDADDSIAAAEDVEAADSDAEALALAEAGDTEPEASFEGEGEEGEADAEEARDPDPLAHAIRTGNYQRNRGNLQAAEASYMRALRLSPNNPRAMAGLVRLNMARGNRSAALRWARRLVEARPQNAANHVLLGDVLNQAGQRRAAIQSWQRALELSPGLRSARQRLGR